jgi:hypothetical protein
MFLIHEDLKEVTKKCAVNSESKLKKRISSGGAYMTVSGKGTKVRTVFLP